MMQKVENRLLFICPYFGKLPDYFSFTQASMAKNQDIDWLILTDDISAHSNSQNVMIHYCSFDDLKHRISKTLTVDVDAITPYKLCDFRPFYGMIFAKEIVGYSFWGHMDLDCCFGRIRHFLTEEILNQNEKVLFLGHLSLYKNNSRINKLAQTYLTYQEVQQAISSPYPWQLDEVGMPNFLMNQDLACYLSDSGIADIYCLNKCFHITHSRFETRNGSIRMISFPENKNYIFSYDNGILMGIFRDAKKIISTEYMYIHFQKRPMKIQTTNTKSFLIVPNAFLSYRKMDEQFIKKFEHEPFFYKECLKIKRRNIENRIRRLKNSWIRK